MDGNITTSHDLITVLVSQITIIFVALTFIGLIIFMSYFTRYFGSESESYTEPELEIKPEPKTENCKNCGGPNVDRVTCEWCGLVLE